MVRFLAACSSVTNLLGIIGTTHEDIDALFGDIRRYLLRMEARRRNYDEFMAHVRNTLRGYAEMQVPAAAALEGSPLMRSGTSMDAPTARAAEP